jgi:hypothetical protein
MYVSNMILLITICSYYKGWHDVVASWGEKGIKVLTYINSFFSDPDAPELTRVDPHEPYDYTYENQSSIPSEASTDHMAYSTGLNQTAGQAVSNIDVSAQSGRPGTVSAVDRNALIETVRSGKETRNLFREGIEHGYFVKDVNGKPYFMHSGSIELLLLDTTHPGELIHENS